MTGKVTLIIHIDASADDVYGPLMEHPAVDSWMACRDDEGVMFSELGGVFRPGTVTSTPPQPLSDQEWEAYVRAMRTLGTELAPTVADVSNPEGT